MTALSLSEKDLKTIIPFDDHLTPPRILILCPDKAMAPLAAADAWYIFKQAGCVVEFATENGDLPKGDPRMLERSAFRDLMGSTVEDIEKFYTMTGSDEFLSPRSWSEPGFSLVPYDAVFLTTGFDTRLRQFLESESLHKLMAGYFPLSKRRKPLQRAPTTLDRLKRRSTTLPNEEFVPTVVSEKHRDELSHLEGPRKVVGAIGKGVLCVERVKVLAEEEKKKVEEAAKKKRNRFSLQRSATTGAIFKSSKKTSQQSVDTQDAVACEVAPSIRSVLYGVETTTAPTWLEHVGTKLSSLYGLKGMFRTYNMSTQDQVIKAIGNPSLFHAGPPNLKPFTHSAPSHHYISSRYPFDAELTSLNVLEEIAIARREWGKSRVE
ncbi:hypothetical protein ABW19_dt0205152 [Dactylella cylindrospora]|nr:hypothetical protein ABW19_dt0205152 [Dactylella cylindrospora]